MQDDVETETEIEAEGEEVPTKETKAAKAPREEKDIRELHNTHNREVEEDKSVGEELRESDKEPGRKPKRNRYQERIDALTRTKYESDARADFFRRQNATLKVKLEESEKNQPMPKAEEFESETDYVRATAAHEAKKTTLTAQSETLQEQETAARYDAGKAAFQAHRERETEFSSIVPDYEAALKASASMPITQDMGDSIIESEISPQIFYHLAKHPEEAARIASLPPHAQHREIGKLEGVLIARAATQPGAQPEPKQKPITDAKPVIRPAGGNSAPQIFNPNQKGLTDEQWVEARRRQRVKGRS